MRLINEHAFQYVLLSWLRDYVLFVTWESMQLVKCFQAWKYIRKSFDTNEIGLPFEIANLSTSLLINMFNPRFMKMIDLFKFPICENEWLVLKVIVPFWMKVFMKMNVKVKLNWMNVFIEVNLNWMKVFIKWTWNEWKWMLKCTYVTKWNECDKGRTRPSVWLSRLDNSLSVSESATSRQGPGR